ncbi:MAG: tetratricopeptide repeat protein [Microcoleaceae cyanobacterium]|jgi:tetratricopeptide (TPR) repeat protein
MVDKRRVLVTVVMLLSLLAFVGFSVIPLVSGILKENQVVSRSPSPSQMATAAAQSDLQAQARGYELVLQREPDNQTALKGLLQVRLELIRLKQAQIKDVIAPLEKLAKLNPDNVEYSVLLAQANEYTGNLEGAALAYRNLLTAKPGTIAALQGLVNLLLQQQRPEAAIGLLQDTLKAAPAANQAQPNSVDIASVQLILGQVYSEQKRYDEAIAIYDEIAKLDGKDFRPVLAKAIIFKLQGKPSESQQLFTKALSMAPAEYKDQIKQLAKGETLKPSPSSSPSSSPSPKSSPDASKSPGP